MEYSDLLFSIIVPAYNVVEYLPRFYQSIIEQTFKNFEVIFVNDGSTDETLEIFKELSKNDKNIKYLNIENQGSGNARNVGLSIAKGKYILFLDPDDCFDKDLLEENVDIVKNKNPDIILFGYRQIDSKTGKSKQFTYDYSVHFNSNKEFRNNFYELSRENSMSAVWNKIYRKDFLVSNKLLFSKNRTGQDAIFSYRSLKYAQNFYVNSNIYYTYFVHRPNSAQSLKREKYKDEIEVFKEKKSFYKSMKKKQELLKYAIIEFYNSEIIHYNGRIPNNIKESEEFIEIQNVLKKIEYGKNSSILENIQLFLLKHNFEKFYYSLYALRRSVKL